MTPDDHWGAPASFSNAPGAPRSQPLAFLPAAACGGGEGGTEASGSCDVSEPERCCDCAYR